MHGVVIASIGNVEEPRNYCPNPLLYNRVSRMEGNGLIFCIVAKYIEVEVT